MLAMDQSKANKFIEELIRANTATSQREEEMRRIFPFDLKSKDCIDGRLSRLSNAHGGKGNEIAPLKMYAKISYLNSEDRGKLLRDASTILNKF